MPPRKRPRGGSVASTSSAGPTPGTRRTRTSTSTTPAPAPSSTPTPSGARTPAPRYRTRHARVVRGPEVAAAEGAEGDLVPPSEDEEYDAWREQAENVNAVRFRSSPLVRSSRSPSPLASASYAGHASPLASPLASLAASPEAGPSRYIPLFDDYASSLEMSGSDDDRKGKGRERSPASLAPVAARHVDPAQFIQRQAAAVRSPAPDSARKRPRSESRSPSPGDGIDIDIDPPDPPYSPPDDRSPVASPLTTPLEPVQNFDQSADARSEDAHSDRNTPLSRIDLSQAPPPPSFIPLSSPRAPAIQNFAAAPGRTSSSLPPPSQSPTAPARHTSQLFPPDAPSQPIAVLSQASALSQTGASTVQRSQSSAPNHSHASVHQVYEEESQLPLGMSQKSAQLPSQPPSQRVSQGGSQASAPYEEESQLPAPLQEEFQLPASPHEAESPLPASPLAPPEAQLPEPMDIDIPGDFDDFDPMASPPAENEVGNADTPRARSPAFVVEITRPRRSDASNAARNDSPDPLDFLRASQSPSPDSPRARPSQRPPQPESIQRPPPSPPATGPSPPPPQDEYDPNEDPALRQFRIARTFRTRTALQLQPYTREKQAYVKALARGGLVKGKRAVAPVSIVAANRDTDTSDSADQEEDGDEDATPPDAIVIGGTQPRREPRAPREPKKLQDEDYDEYFLRFGGAPDEDDPTVATRLQVIARERIHAAKAQRRAARAAERTKREFEALMAGHGRAAREDDKQKQRAEREKEAAERQERKKREAAEREEKRVVREKQRAENEKMRREKEERRRAKGLPPRESKSKTPRGPRVYGKRHQRPVTFDDDSSGLSDPPPLDPPGRERQESPTAFLRDDDDDFGGNGFGFDAPAPSPSPPRTTARRISSSESDAPRPRSQRRTQRPPSDSDRNSASSSDSGSESSPSDAPDRRERIARRMLPAFMLKRLAAQEKDKQARRAAAAERRKNGNDSPVRPGHAVRRRGAAAGMEGMDDLWDDEESRPSRPGRRDEGRENKENTRPRSASPARRARSPRTPRPRLDPDDEDDADLRLEPAHIDLSFSVHGSPRSPDGTADAPIGFDLDASESDGRASPTPAIVISSGSEAEEDNTETLAFLHRGDFEAILRGRGAAVVRPLDHKHQTDRERRRKRKPLRPVLRRLPFEEEGKLVQTRLNLQPLRGAAWENGAVPEPGPAGAARRTGGQMKITDWDRRERDRRGTDKRKERKRGPRPAIRLDDRTIFATEEFAFESEDEQPRRAFARVPSRNKAVASPRTPAARALTPLDSPRGRGGTPAHLDDGVGKARSWANFETFPVDFDIKPLPSGVYLSGGVIAELPAFLQDLRGEHGELAPVDAFGVHLYAGMDAVEARGVVPIVLDGASAALRAYIDDPERDRGVLESVLSPLSFFRDLLLRSPQLTEAVYPAISAFEAQLADISLTSRLEDRVAVDQMVLVRYALLQIAIVAAPATVVAATERLFSLLLTYGFDRTLKPVRRILRGEEDTPEIDDRSVGVWVAVQHVLRAAAARAEPTSSATVETDMFATALLAALEQRYAGEIGPLAAERVWFLVFGLCALSQFDASGAVAAEYTPHPRWGLVKRAIGLIKVTHSQESEEAAQLDTLRGRDRYIKTMVARCLRLSSAWAWSFDRGSFTVATRDLGMIFKERQHRNLPTEPPADFPPFIAEYDISLSATDTAESTRRASAFGLYLRLASVAASDVIACAQELSEAQRAERDVQRLIMGIFPLSAVAFTRASPPTARQLAALVNRYATMVVACYFSPSLLPWLLSNSARWLDFKTAGFESRQVVIRGLMYLAVAVRHHAAPLEPVVARLAEILAILQGELAVSASHASHRLQPTRVEVERTMVLVVTAFREIILHPGYSDRGAVYPDPALLHESWTARIFDLDLAKDVKSGLEIVSTIQAYLDARAAALPKRAAAARRSAHDSLDDWPSLGFDFDAVDLAALGGDEAVADPVEEADARFAVIVRDTINPKIYRLLNDMLPPVIEEHVDRAVLVGRLTKCWSDCAAVVVVEHRLMDWSSYIGAFGQQSWSRLGNEAGRHQVGLHFMLNVARLDPSAFRTQEEEFLALLLQALVADKLTIQHKYVSALLSLSVVLEHVLLAGVRSVLAENGLLADGDGGEVQLSRTAFIAHRPALLRAIFSNIAPTLASRHTPAETKSFIYRAINTIVASMASAAADADAAVDATGAGTLRRANYRAFVVQTLGELRRVAGEYVHVRGVPALKSLEWAG